MRVFILAGSACMALTTSTAFAAFQPFETTLSFKNLCDFQINLYDNTPHTNTGILPGVIFTRTFDRDWDGMFRHGEKPQATLAEFTFAHTKEDPVFNGNWYDISIIPTGYNLGPGDCKSFEACRALTKDVGYNVPMQIKPLSNLDTNCVVVTCMEDGCDEAYKFPTDDTNTHFCKPGTNFDITFCPGGTGGQTPAPTTPAPTIESGSMDALLNSGLEEGSGSSNATEVSVVPTPEPTTVAPVVIDASTTEAPAVEANTQSEGSESSATGTVFLVIGAVAAAAGVAMIVVIRRKKAALDAMERKDSIALTTPSHVL